ncbi:hypothetical protein [Paeniglutamicibacter terrestris]|uniref:Uncharacterized protein n=1 Tax=Paeniglutamicibacter terrestris TaxID=2723403 RepID=A0ABX1G891_9MICC|nr:hypothetical protein [Paeniglutamicibacter terrestris]NKG22238.1 hypothetical protein [Paeniglutamicibacter terrestris]
MDLSESIIAKSDQQNAADYLSGPRTFTIDSVSPGSREQPVNVYLVEAPGKPYRPSKTMRRVLVAIWGKDSTQYAGRRFTLYCDPSVMFGGVAVGGIKISHMSHLEKRRVLVLTATQKTKAEHVIMPLKESAPQPVDLTIPAEVLATIAKAMEAGTLADYLEYANTNNAPAHIIEHIQASLNSLPD